MKFNGQELPINWITDRENLEEYTAEIAFTDTTVKDIPRLVGLLNGLEEFKIEYTSTFTKEFIGPFEISAISYWSTVGYVVATLQKSTL